MVAPALTWLVQATWRDLAQRERIERALDALGEDHCVVEVAPFRPELPALPFAVHERRVICLGPSFVPRVANEPTWQPGIFFDARSFRWSTMAARWGELMLMQGGEVVPASRVLDELDERGPWFVRPDEDSKAFDGGVFSDARELRRALGATAPLIEVVRGPVLAIDAEWRCFVVGDTVVDSSEYRRGGVPSFHRGAPPGVLAFVEAAVARWSPAAVTCIDVAASGARFGIVEANCFGAARLYAADAQTVLAAVGAHVRAAAADGSQLRALTARS